MSAPRSSVASMVVVAVVFSMFTCPARDRCFGGCASPSSGFGLKGVKILMFTLLQKTSDDGEKCFAVVAAGFWVFIIPVFL